LENRSDRVGHCPAHPLLGMEIETENVKRGKNQKEVFNEN
jgi:hypothetical protein